MKEAALYYPSEYKKTYTIFTNFLTKIVFPVILNPDSIDRSTSPVHKYIFLFSRSLFQFQWGWYQISDER